MVKAPTSLLMMVVMLLSWSTKESNSKESTRRLVIYPTQPNTQIKSSRSSFNWSRRPLRLKIPRNGLKFLNVWLVSQKRPPPVLPDSSKWPLKENSLPELSMLTIVLPNPNSITSMVADTVSLTVLWELPMLWLLERNHWSAVMVMSEKVALLPLNPADPELPSLKSIPSVPCKL